MGIIGVLIALSLPMLARTRAVSNDVRSLSNARQIAGSLSAYGADYGDLPPVLLQPLELYYPPDYQEVEVNGFSLRDNWFDHKYRYHIGLWEYLDARVVIAPGSTIPPLEFLQSPRGWIPDYILAQCLYAEPGYWNRWTQRGPSQWAAQRLSNITSPSNKGILYQMWVYGLPGMPHRQQAQAFANVPAAVAWADGSASTELLPALHPGEPNFYSHSFPDTSYLSSGFPIEATFNGVAGVDRGGAYQRPRRLPAGDAPGR